MKCFDFRFQEVVISDLRIFERAVMFQLKNSNYKLDALLHFDKNGNFSQNFKIGGIFNFFKNVTKRTLKLIQVSYGENEGTRKIKIQGGKICKISQLNMKSTVQLRY